MPLDMVVSTKKQKFIRASIFNPTKTAGATIVYNDKKIQTHEESGSESSLRMLSGEDAAGNLFDLLALNPEYHFSKDDSFNLKIPVFDGYRLELLKEDTPIAGTDRYRPKKMLLYEVGDTDDSLIRSIEYISYFEMIEPYLLPKEIKFIDESTGETGRITVQKVEYNVGLPDFLFRIREPAENLKK